MSEMVERVARAAFISVYGDPYEDDWKIQAEHICHIGSQGFLDAARAAIKAMREPTEAMIEAGQDDFAPSARDVWQEMIDEALKEPPATP